MNLAELQKEAHAIAKQKGWWDEPRTFGDLIALVHSELSGALEAYRQEVLPSKPHLLSTRVKAALAEVMIRVAVMAEHYGVDLVSLNDYSAVRSRATFGEWIAALHQIVSRALYWRESVEIAPGSWEQCLRYAVTGVESMAAHYGIDLDSAIVAKMEYHRTRTYRHGGKAL